MEFIKTINDKDYTDIAVNVFNILKTRYGYTLRISRILEIIKDVFLFGQDLLLVDINFCNNGSFDSFMMDRMIDWQQGKEVSFSKIKEEIYKTYQFSSSEKLILETGSIEERLWGFFLALSKSQLE
jgi:hypothetical protein